MRRKVLFLLFIPCLLFCRLSAETMLQYFNTSWAEITRKMPELAEAGYSSLWLPPPTKGSGGLSVGYDLWDPFDLGSKDQRNTVKTRYGTEAELLELVKTAHRFGIRVYFDNIMNHRAFDIPGYNETTSIDIYPGLVPEDFHLKTTQEGFYRKWDNTRDWNSSWQVQNLGLADLIDIAQEPGATNQNFGSYEGATGPKIKFIRDLERPSHYAYDKDGNYVGFGGLLDLAEQLLIGEGNPAPQTEEIRLRAKQYLQDNASVYEEYVEDYLNRAARWLMDRTKADGLRLDAVKHVRADFFGATYGAEKDTNDYGYSGQVQRQFNLTRGYSDSNHRDTLFDTEAPRDDAMLFGEHLGEPPGYGSYIDAGMRLVDNPLRQQFNDRLGSPYNGLNGFDTPGAGGFSPETTVMHAQSHDSDYAARRELQHAMYFTRAGLGLLYTDGNYQAETLGESGGAFPRHSNTSFLGQWDDPRVPNLLYIHQQFARGYQQGKYSDADVVVYERVDKRSNGGMSDADGVTLLFMLNDDYSSGHGVNFNTSFPATPGGADAYLYNYSTYGGGFYTYASNIVNGSVVVPAGGYFAFSWKNPDPQSNWAAAGGRPITFYQGGEEVGTIDVIRQDGPNGDADFHGDTLQAESRPLISNPDSGDYQYTATLPRITDGSSLRIVARADGSAENILMRLNGGIDLNGTQPPGNIDPAKRDFPPAVSYDMFLGFEQPTFTGRFHPELFAAQVVGNRDITGSVGAETYTTAGVLGQGAGTRFTDGDTASFAYHDPQALVDDETFAQWDGNKLWAKVNAVGAGYKMFVYYTPDASFFPEGSAGDGVGETRVVEMSYQKNADADASNWWATPDMPADFVAGTSRYKIGVVKEAAPSWFPGSYDAVQRKSKMLTRFEVSGFNADTVEYYPHYDYAKDLDDNPLMVTGLEEGFHILRARAFLKRDNQASIFNTFSQSFYYDAQRPQGEIRYPENNGDTVGGSNYGVVVRSDSTVTEVWYCIADADPSNDDVNTGARNGNGVGFEPFTDTNRNGTWDSGEAFQDLNNNATWDTGLASSWVKATEVTPSLEIIPGDAAYTKEWRFTYENIPESSLGDGTAQVKVRFLELSSAGYENFADTDPVGHFTTLTRTVNVDGPDKKLFVAYPPSDGQIVGDDYVMKVFFSKSLADGLTEQELIDRFLIRIGSNEANDEGNAQDRSAYVIEYNTNNDFHALAYDLPNLYNDQPDYLHKITVELDQPLGQADFEATRLVKALPVTTPRVLIVNPPELGSDGRSYEIVMPDVDTPSLSQRQFTIQVATNLDATQVNLQFVNLRGSSVGSPTVTTEGSSKLWDFVWQVVEEGSYRFTATVTSSGGSAEASRNTTVVFRQVVASDENDDDDDDDGILDSNENTAQVLPNQSPDGGITAAAKPNPEQWINREVHEYYAYGKTNPFSPDSDGDGLPDGLEVGWRTSSNPPTDPATDTDGNGVPNFRPDLDPPFFNTLDNEGSVPDVNSASEGGDRAKQLVGTVTDPGNPDTDGDGILDGVEDANQNGWVDGDGEALDPTFNPWLERDWPDGVKQPLEIWTETDPNNADTDGDALTDGYGEDKDRNGLIAGDSNGDRIYDAGEAWTETDPLNADTDGDGLPDGWEVNNGLDPLDDGTDKLSTLALNDGLVVNGASGDPDADGFTNAQELLNQTRPFEDDTLPPPPANSIVIGVGESETYGDLTQQNEFTDWTADDLLVLDEYEGDGTHNQGGDTYLGYDGGDTSRDMVAFYFRDGGADGKLYFRVDFHDLVALAEEGKLDLYVVIDTGNPAVGESALPDDVDTRTEMKWEAVVAVYQSNNGAVYVDTDSGQNTTTIAEDLFAKGVVRRDQNAVDGFELAYFNSELDAVEFSISRAALLDAGWNGNADNLNFQVYTTKDGTGNSPVGGGDIGGRSDIRDSIYDDYLGSDYWRDQGNIGGSGSVLYSWFGRNAGNDRGKRAKVALIAHGNQPIRPGSEMQDRIHNDAGAGYYRLIEAHGAFSEALNLHLTATLASAIQWAAVDPSLSKPWRDGPSLNARVKDLISVGVVHLLGTTFSDHMLPFTSTAYTVDNIQLASEVLGEIYGAAPSDKVLWAPERVLDGETLTEIAAMGYTHTVADQMRHIFKWFGRNEALGSAGYRLNEVNGLKLFVINDFASDFRFQNQDNGLSTSLRELLSRRARSGTQDQVLILVSDLEDFREKDQADAYDRNLRWLANRPWIELVSLDHVARGGVDLSQPPDHMGDHWGTVGRGSGLSLNMTSKDYIDHATQESYSNWYFGQAGREEGLNGKVFEIRSGVSLPGAFGEIGVGGISDTAWTQVDAMSGTDGLSRLGRATLHAGMFVTAFHNQSNNDLSKFSTGAYIYPDTDAQTLADFSKRAQAQVRQAALYKRAETWAASATATTTAAAEDVDLDGENEYVLANDQVFAVFEAMGGRLVVAFARNPENGKVFQVVGAQPGYARGETEEEGTANVVNDAVDAHRSSGFKDWYADGAGGGSSAYVNGLYTVTAAGANGWTFTAPGGHIVKTISLADGTTRLQADYSLSGDVNKLYIRMGLSPDLNSMLVRGQQDLSEVLDMANNRYAVINSRVEPVTAALSVSQAALNTNAVDDVIGVLEFDTVNMRNQAFTRQMEVENENGENHFSIVLSLETGSTDRDADGLPAWWEFAYFGSDTGADPDADAANGHNKNREAFIAGFDPTNPEAGFGVLPSSLVNPSGPAFDLPTVAGRVYTLWYNDDPLTAPDWKVAETVTGTGALLQWEDDGTHTSPAPSMVEQRFYRVSVDLAP
ncbi:alpha-amylase family glycosyl hydrolase [Kiritimatiellaeota bacterium B1221]|nr:alpha-amylase family glycosyl hydrolase [Kiritimatiellaeota bacterium B1221]